MEVFIVVLVISLFVFLNSLPFIAGVLATPAGSIFLGTVHWPGDYFYYLSQFAQGAGSWFTSYDLYTNDFGQKTMVGWVNVFLGRLFSLVGVDHLTAYQLSIVIFTISFLALSYLLILEIYSFDTAGSVTDAEVGHDFFAHLPNSSTPSPPANSWFSRTVGVLKKHGLPASANRLIAFILFVTSNAFPGYDYWFNNGIPFNRLGGVPHHLIARMVIVLSLLLALKWWKKGGKRKLLILALIGFILAGTEPVHWLLVVMVLSITGLINIFCRPKLAILLPSFFLFLGGLPMAIYIKRIFANPPYSQLVVWEASQQVNISILNFILANGPVMVLAIVGFFVIMPRVLPFSSPKIHPQGDPDFGSPRFASPATALLMLFPLLTLIIFFSPLPRWVGIVNVRFLPAVTTLFLAVLAAEGIFSLKRGPLARARSPLITTAVVVLMLPSYYVQIQNRIKTEPSNAFFYVTQGIYESFREAEKISSIKDTFLVIWPFNWSFPGITGRRVYEGHSLLTSDYDKKELMTRSFFFGDMSITEMEKMLRVNRIDYVMTYPWTRNINELTNLENIYDNRTLGIYKVKR